MNPLDNLEQLAQRFVEGTFHRFFGKTLHVTDLADQLVASVEAARNGRDSSIPADYQLTVNPTDYVALTRQNSVDRITSELVTHLAIFANESNYQLDDSPRITLYQNELVQSGHVEVRAIEFIDGDSP